MIICEIFRNDETHTLSLTCEGHAGSAENPEESRICAGASTLACTVAQLVMAAYHSGQLLYKPVCDLSSGETRIKCVTVTDEDYGELARAFLFAHTGFHLLAFKYPEKVLINPFEDTSDSSIDK